MSGLANPHGSPLDPTEGADAAPVVFQRGFDLNLLAYVLRHGWRTYLHWGLCTVVIALGLAFVFRFAVGLITPTDFIALVAVVGPLLLGQLNRSQEVRAAAA